MYFIGRRTIVIVGEDLGGARMLGTLRESRGEVKGA